MKVQVFRIQKMWRKLGYHQVFLIEKAKMAPIIRWLRREQQAASTKRNCLCNGGNYEVNFVPQLGHGRIPCACE